MRPPGPATGALLLTLPLLLALAGCRSSSTTRRDDVAPPFVFRSLDLRQQTPLGQPSWELTSSEARYDLRRRLAQASDLKGLIYSRGKPLYRIQAESGTVVRDGEAILLEGNLRVQRLGAQTVLIRASRARWLPRRQLLLVDRHPEALDQQGRLGAERARFLLNEDRLILSGHPRMERWEQRRDPLAREARPPAPIAIDAVQVSWKPGSGELQASGPVRGRRRPPGNPASQSLQNLSADSLEGNTITQVFTLRGQVRLDDSGSGDSFSGQDVRLAVASGEASTIEPFRFRRGDLQASGRGLKIDGRNHWLRIDAACRVERPGERLEANRCGWNWKSSAIEAEGGVLLQRSAQDQTTRGQSLSGSLGEGGSLRISAPGSRVVSRFRPPPPQQAPKAPTGQAPGPIAP